MSNVKPTLLDRAIGHFSPQRGLKRYQARMNWNLLSSVKTTAGSSTGPIGNWLVRFLGRREEDESRGRGTARAQDLVNNDPHAASVIDSMSMNIVGTGIKPQARPKQEALGWSDEETRKFQRQAEWIFEKWSGYADSRGMLSFDELQFLTVRSLLVSGEYFRVPVMQRGRYRPLSLALQGLSPFRITTPADHQHDPQVRQGVWLDSQGRARRYFAYDPPPNVQPVPGGTGPAGPNGAPDIHFRKFPAWVHPLRPGMIHGFIQKEEEQIRGSSILTPAMKMFRDLSDYFDYELVGAIVASSFPVWIETETPKETAKVYEEEDESESQEESQYQEVEPGQLMYGNSGEKPHLLKPERPTNTFGEFTEKVLRAQGASVGMPYEVISKDFSKTTYSSARAALLEADRTFRTYRHHFTQGFLQPTWGMVLEEAWLRGKLELPQSGPDFYEAFDEITRCAWIPPRKGHVDPVKETQSEVKGLKEGTLSFAEVLHDKGGDWEEHFQQLRREQDKAQELDLNMGRYQGTSSSSSQTGGEQ